MTAERESMTLQEMDAPALGVEERRDEAPRAGAPISCNVIDSLSAVIGIHLHRPTVIPSGAGVSVMLAERAAIDNLPKFRSNFG